MPTIAIVITCFNQSIYTKRAVESLCWTTRNTDEYDFEFAVFDDSSTDDTQDVVRSAGGGKAMYWCSEQNEGVTYLWNAAYRHFSKSDYIVIVNNDVIFTPNWCYRILDVMRRHKCAMAGPITNGPGHVLDQDVRNFICDYEPSDDWKNLVRLSDNLKHLEPFEVPRINGFCMVFETAFLRRAQQERVGEPFDPKNRDFGNEDEIQARLNPRPRVVPSSFVFHYKRVTFQDYRPRNFIQYRPRELKPFDFDS
jgi:glycosyltransferase involved in cell wall biosynthesis